jgi:hypothetical protein
MGFCRNDYIKYSSQFQFTLLCDNVNMHLNRTLAFAFLGENTYKKSFNLLMSNNCSPSQIQPNSSCNGFEQLVTEKSYHLSRAAHYISIT